MKSFLMDERRAAQSRELCELGREFHARGWSLGTSSNYSIVLNRDPLRLLITASGRDKSQLSPDDTIVVDGEGAPCETPAGKPSAETLLHCVLAQDPGVGAVLHTHSVWSTILSDVFHASGGFEIQGYEMLKGLAGVSTHEHRQWVEIFENSQDIPALADEIARRLSDVGRPLNHGLLLRRHGLYTWGADLAEARRHVEIFEFLFEVLGLRLGLPGGLTAPSGRRHVHAIA
jgi:methylthioribulose-1-phosphate dehydratase